jgi:hypothetical protein
VLADQATSQHQALDRAAADGLGHLILDWKIFDTDRCRTKTTGIKGERVDFWYLGKTGDFSGNVQALMEPGGFPTWTCDVDSGHTVDMEASATLIRSSRHQHGLELRSKIDDQFN